jgi:exonuclease V gamma subunit
LSCDPFQGNYLKTLPLHPSQEILKDDEDALQIRLYVEPNFELRSKIMKIADSVKVIRPEWLATEIQNKLKKALNQYQSGN